MKQKNKLILVLIICSILFTLSITTNYNQIKGNVPPRRINAYLVNSTTVDCSTAVDYTCVK